MRKARSGDHWRRIYSRQFPKRIDSVAFERISGFADSLLKFSGGITAICGQNGTGKTTLLEAIFSVLKGPKAKPQLDTSKKHPNILIDAVVSHMEGATKFRLKCESGVPIESLPTPFLEVHASWLEMSKLSTGIFHKIRNDKNFSDLLEPLEPKILTEGECAELSAIVGKNYKRVEIFEIEDYIEDSTAPYFRVSVDGLTYDSLRMGQGELAIFCGWWWITAMTDPTSIVFLEEPENYISPRAQTALMDFLALQCDRRKLWVIISTHSSHILSRIPREHIRVLIPTVGGVRISEVPHEKKYFEQLGLEWPKSGVIFVEDEDAKDLFKFIALKSNSWILADRLLVAVDGESHVLGLLKHFPKPKTEEDSRRMIGVLDRDQVKAERKEKVHWPLLFLPGNSNPSDDLRLAAGKDPAHFAVKLGLKTEKVNEALAVCSGSDSHDWFKALGESLGMPRDVVFNAAASVWYERGGQADCDMFMATVESVGNCSLVEGKSKLNAGAQA